MSTRHVKSELDHKRELFFKYLGKFGEDEMVKRLGLKDWEIGYIHGLIKYKYADRSRKEQSKG